MAENEGLKRNLDKISYGVAIVLAIGIIALPLVFGNSTGKLVEDTREEVTQLRGRIESNDNAPLQDVPSWNEELSKSWDVPTADEAAEWVAYVQPAVVKKYDTTPPPVGMHEPGAITQIEVLRDAEKKKAYLRVMGKLSTSNAHVEISRIDLERKEDDKDWVLVPDFAETTDFTYDDHDVEAGKLYAYRFTSTAEPVKVEAGAKQPEPPANRQQQSLELVVSDVVPNEVSFILRGAGFVTDIDPKVHGELKFWDYENDKVKTLRSNAAQPWISKFGFGGKLENGKNRFEIYRILPETQQVQIRDLSTTPSTKIMFDTKNKKHRPVGLWTPATQALPEEAAAEEEESGTEEAADTPAPEKKAAPAPKKPKTGKRSGRRGFGK